MLIDKHAVTVRGQLDLIAAMSERDRDFLLLREPEVIDVDAVELRKESIW